MLNTLNINLKTDIKTDRPTTLPITLMSQDKNNNQFILRFTNGGEPVNLDDTYTVEILTKFKKSGTSRLTSATVRQDYATWEFDTAYITQDETVYNYVYVRKSGNLIVSADANCFVFSVDLSEIDKGAGKVAETYDENYEKYLDEFKDNVDFEEIAQAEQARREAELLREESYEQKVDTAIVEADVVEKVDNKVTELTPQINNLTAQLAQIPQQITTAVTPKADKIYVDNITKGLVSGAPKAVATVAGMTDTNKNYVYVGSEVGYENGHWYYYNGTSWVSGGIYQAVVEPFPSELITLTNKVANGDISKTPSGTGWKLSGSVSSWNVDGGTFNFVAGANRGGIIQSTAFALVQGHRYYLRTDIKANTEKVFARISNNAAPYNTIVTIDNLDFDGANFRKYSTVFVSNGDYANATLGVYDNRTTGFDTVSFDNVMLIDLTEIFGEGKEPNIAQFEAALSQFTNSWFDATTIIEQRASVLGDIILATDFKVDNDNDDTNAINRALGQASKLGGATVRLPYKFGGYVISDTLLMASNTTLMCDEGVEVFLASNSNCRMVENVNKSTQSDLTVNDKNISVIGGIWNGNGDYQIKWLPDGGVCTGFLFSGVENLTFEPKKIVNTQTYSAWFCNVHHVIAEHIILDQGPMPAELHNQDGLHFQGPSDNIYVNNISGHTWDDMVAFNADDVEQGMWSTTGDITFGTIENITVNGGLNGVRLLSATSKIDHVTIRNIKGTIKDNLIALSAYGLGIGNFGDINIEDIEVGTLKPNFVDGKYGGYILINNKVNGKVTIKNVRRLSNYDGRPTVRLQPEANVKALEINDIYLTNLVGTATYGDIYVEPTAKCDLLMINGQRIQGNDTAKANTGIAIYGDVKKLLIDNVFYEKINGVFDIAGNIDYLNANNIKSLDSTSNMKFDGNRVINTLTIGSGVSAGENITIILQNVATSIALAPTDTTPTLVASKIRATAFTGWSVSGSGDKVIFTANQPYITLANQAAPLFAGGVTGVTGAYISTQGTKNIGKAVLNNLDLPKTQAYITTKNITGGDIEAKFDSISHYTQSVDKAIAKSYDILKFDTKVKDSFSEYVPSTGVFTAKNDGYYRLTYGITINSAVANTIKLYLKLNGTDIYSTIQDVAAGGSRYFDINRTVKLKAGDTLSITFANTTNTTMLKDSYVFVNRI